MMETISKFMVFQVKHPFIKVKFERLWFDVDTDEWMEEAIDSWAPGVRFEDKGIDSATIADAMGFQIITVVSTHKPAPKYPTRVFYTRQWVDPYGKKFGKTKLHIKSIEAFKRLVHGYKYTIDEIRS